MTSTRPISCQFQAPHIVLESRPPASLATTRPQFRKANMHTARCCYVSSASDRFPHRLDEYGRPKPVYRPFLPPTGSKHPLTCPSDAQNIQPMGKATIEAPLRRQNHPANGIIRTLASQPAVIPAHARKQRRHPSALKSPSPLSARKTDSCFGEHEPGRHLFQRLGNHSAEAPPPSPITPNHPPTRAGTTSYPQPAIRLSEGSLRKIASNHESLSSSRPTA